MFGSLSRGSILSILAACVATGAWAASADAKSIGFHWDSYQANGNSAVVGTDGVVPQAHWNNAASGWGAMSASNLVDSDGAITTASVTANGAPGAGTDWWVSGPVGGLSNLLVGPWGGNGAHVNVISGIPYASYEIIAYVNQPYDGAVQTWLDSNPLAANTANLPVAGSLYFSHGTGSTPGFVEVTNQNPAMHPNGNYVVYSGLTGSTQAIWLDSNDANRQLSSFQIIDTSSPPPPDAPEPATLGTLGLGALLLLRRRK